MTQSPNQAGRSVGCGCLSLALIASLLGFGLLAFLTPQTGSDGAGPLAGIGLILAVLILVIISGAVRFIRRSQPAVDAADDGDRPLAPETTDRPRRPETRERDSASRPPQPPVTPTSRARPPRDQTARRGWYPDPDDPQGEWLRWWNGESWTDHVREA